MKNSSSVRRPSLVTSSMSQGHNGSDKSIGDSLRKARKDLFFSRCVWGIFIVLLVTVIAVLFIQGYVDRFIDFILSLVD